MTMPDDIDLVALHEAAHAVVALLLLGDAAVVGTVRASAVGMSAGYVALARPMTPGDLRLAIIALAGPEASRLAGHDAPYRWGAGDAGQALTVVLLDTGIGGAGFLRDVLAEAMDAVDAARRMAVDLVEAHWPEIVRGAAALAEAPGRVMTGPEFARAAGGAVAGYAGPETTPAAPAESGYLVLARCPMCGVAAVMPGVVAGWLNPSTAAAWAAVQMRAAGCTHTADDGALGAPLGMVPYDAK